MKILNHRSPAPPPHKLNDPELPITHAFPRKFLVKTVNVNGVAFRLYSVGWLAYASGRTPRSIHRWERKGMFPRPLCSLNDGNRWYLGMEVHGYTKLIQAAGMRMGRLPKGQEPPLKWLARNAAEFRTKLKALLAKQTKTLPTQYKDEERILRSLANKKTLRFTPETLLSLVQ